MSKKQTYFRNDWLSNPDFKVCLRYRGSKTAFCQKCKKTIELSDIGEQALESQMKSKKHLKNMKPIYRLFQPRSQPVKNTTEQLIAEPSGSTSPVN